MSRIRALVIVAFVLAAVGAVSARAATPSGGTLDASHDTVTWTGGPLLFTTIGTDCQLGGPTCDGFALTVGALDPAANDVVIGAQAGNPTDVILLYVYDSSGTQVGSSNTLSSTPSVEIRDPQPGTYTVYVEALIGFGGPITYSGRAITSELGEAPAPEVPCNGVDEGLGPPPAEVLQAALTDDGRRVAVDVLVLLDGVSQAHAERLFEIVGQPYGELNIDVVPTFQVVDPAQFQGTNTTSLIEQTRRLFPDHRVPFEYDVVELLTNRDVEAIGQTAVAGQAKCIGGAAFKEHSFEVSEAQEDFPQEGVAIGPLTFVPEIAAKITAHEMGHLFGAQHHFANCIEALLPGGVTDDDSSPCTLMFSSGDFIALKFSTLNAKIVRGYALSYSTANDA